LEQIPFLDLFWQNERVQGSIRDSFEKVFDRNWFILGREVDAFEKEYAAYSGTPFCVGVGSGLDAITLSLRALGIGDGDEVIVPAHTYLATWLGVVRTGAIPVAVDADPSTYNIDVSLIPSKITERTRALLPVHLYGQPCNMTHLDELARQFNLQVVEDNAQAHGARWGEKKTGSFGAVNATSFYPTKNLGALGDGGAVTLFDPEKADVVRSLRNYGLVDKVLMREAGMNSRLDEVQAAFLRVKLLYLDEWNIERRRLAALYLEGLDSVGDLVLPLADKECEHVYHLFVVQSKYRDELRNYLRSKGMATLIHYPVPPHLQDGFRNLNYKRGDFPVTEQLAEEIMSLPLWPGMSDDQVGRVIKAVRDYFSER
jgi:dTDP-4-amino-4,6-dideoxygalactose transaminase